MAEPYPWLKVALHDVDDDVEVTVQAPYNCRFIKEAKALGGWWNHDAGAWCFLEAQFNDVLRIAVAAYAGFSSPLHAGEQDDFGPDFDA